jgi:hypothetical protein
LRIEVTLPTADRKVGPTTREFSPQLAPYVLSDPAVIEGVDSAVSRLDFVFCTPQLERPKA